LSKRRLCLYFSRLVAPAVPDHAQIIIRPAS
jgi:hypothetical protein